MLREIIVDLDSEEVSTSEQVPETFGKALAVRRIIEADAPDRTVYLSGYTPLAAAGLGFAGKLNVYGISLLGNNLQGSRSGGLFAPHLTRLGIAGIKIAGASERQLLLLIGEDGNARLAPLADYCESVRGTYALADSIYRVHGEKLAVALTDPATTGFFYNAIVCNTQYGAHPDRAASRSTSRFGRNGLVGIVVARAPRPLHAREYDHQQVAKLLREMFEGHASAALAGSSDPEHPLLGGTYGGAAKPRFDNGHGLTNLFRSARVPDEHYERLLPDTIARGRLELANEAGVTIRRRSCLRGCPNQCIQVTLLHDADAGVSVLKAGEWETYQGVLNLGLFDSAVRTSAEILAHSNEFAYDHIEALVTLAALALVTETKEDTGVRYGDRESVLSTLSQAVAGTTELGRLIRRGAAAVENEYGMERHFTVGGHALPFHNGRSMLQTGIGLSWTYARHGESCAGPGRHNFLGEPYDPADHTLDPEVHVLNTVHGMVMYGALDEQGLCFFMGPSVGTLLEIATLLRATGVDADARQMLRTAAQTIHDVYEFNLKRGVHIQPLPRVFYEQATYGNRQTPGQAVKFNVPFDIVHDCGLKVLKQVAAGEVTVPEHVLAQANTR